VTAFAETCRSIGVSVSIERSRSGNGGHARGSSLLHPCPQTWRDEWAAT
jgi:hypothetical protein